MPPVGATRGLPLQGGLLSRFLGEQQSLTAVERFSSYHDSLTVKSPEPLYRELIPLRTPKPGEQYAFEVNLDRCSGCKACVTACHNLNGLDEGETWRAVGHIQGAGKGGMPQHVTTACHHCAEPVCAHGCPTLAYEKDPITGIVRHLDDQCFGCQYCSLKCPYDAPQYNAEKGIVRKCDMCSDRLSAGEAPACAQACPTGAIKIVLVETAILRAEPETAFALPGAHDPEYTIPTTQYLAKHPIAAGSQASDAHQVKPEHWHLSLAFMLVFSQGAAGFWILHAGTSLLGSPANAGFAFPFHPEALGFALVAFALNLSLLHLGRPWLAWKAVLGWRRSWLSREVIVFSALAGSSSLSALFPAIPAFSYLAALSALAAVYASAMVYRDTPRPLWASRMTLWRFSLTTLLCGIPAYALITGSAWPVMGLPPLMLAKLALENRVLKHLSDEEPNALWKAAQLLAGRLGIHRRLRVALGMMGGIFLPVLFSFGVLSGPSAIWVAAALLFVLPGELLERALFLATGIAPRMPGGR